MPGRKLVLIVIDGLTPSVFEDAVERGRAPALAFLAGAGSYRRAISTFPSLTPVCASSIATGAHPDVHHIPHLVWYERDERRLIEYGSSLGAVVAAGTRRSILDTIFHMNGRHLGARRGDRVRGARRRRAADRGGELHLLPRAHRAPHDAARA